jgi:hypothetical protein
VTGPSLVEREAEFQKDLPRIQEELKDLDEHLRLGKLSGASILLFALKKQFGSITDSALLNRPDISKLRQQIDVSESRVSVLRQANAAPAPAQNTAAAEAARAAVSKMVNLGLIKRMDVKTGKFYIDGPLWEGFELDAKESVVKTISGYREAEYKGLPQVTLYESRTGKELASYGAFGGVTIQ